VNGERLGTYNGHQGALWTVDVDPTTTILATGAADNTIKLWEVRTGRCLKTWEFPTAVKRVEFSEDGTLLLAVTEMRMGHLGTVAVFPIVVDVEATQAEGPLFTITFEDSKATVAAWGYLNKYIITGHEDGSVSQYDGKVRLDEAWFIYAVAHANLDRRICSSGADPRARNAAHRHANVCRQDLFPHYLEGQEREGKRRQQLL
jgi:WD40 repeat protein